MPVWLVTGGSGFLGRHVLSVLEDSHAPESEVFSLGRRCPADWPRERFITADLEIPSSVSAAFERLKPDVVIHAAGKTPPADPEQLYQANTLATLHLLDALRATGRAVRVVLAGSAAELGPVPVEALPVGEGYPCRPAEPYGMSKWLATSAALAARPPLEVVVGRVFNPIGPRTPESQAFGRFAARLMEPTLDVLDVGDLDARRDFVDVRDVARAFVALAERGRPGQVYHIGTGRSQRVGAGLSHFLQRYGRPVRIDHGERRPSGPNDSRADVRRIAEDVGWRAVISWEQSLDDLWDQAVLHAARSCR